ncbi:acid protease [Purpureocillium lavendulum]|uniref:Acid protease n=1 Tax=Purpureocillium lavendulum TaxID=1247861 RepID=A0AB34FR44_9HYPO|nr:acid protease [Purpureocillium lavendulum]
MANWKELGEIPDSEEEDGFDSQEIETAAFPQAPTNAPDPRPSQDSDIWDVPDSQSEHRGEAPGKLPVLPGRTTTPPFDQLPYSSPLSSVPSEHDLPPVDELLLSRDVDEHAVVTEPSQPPPSTHTPPREAASPGPRRTRIEIPLYQNQHRFGDVENDPEARQVAVRYERSLRPRKPIQEHPYLLENVQYSNLFKKHGVKPVRVAVEPGRRRQEDMEQDHDFQEESQDTAEVAGESQAQLNAPSSSLGARDPFDFPSSSPPKTPPVDNRGKGSSRASSPGDTDDTSVLDQDLPALDDLFMPIPRLVSKKGHKRQSSPPPPTIRKRRRTNIINSDPVESNAAPNAARASPDPVSSTLHIARQTPSAALRKMPLDAQPQTPRTEVEPHPIESIIDISSDEGRTLPPSPESSSESDEEVVNTIGRRIRGVLPASWLRLDQQFGRDKLQADIRKSKHRQSPGREVRRGVAQSRPALPGSTAANFFFDESDDSDAGKAASYKATVDWPFTQARLSLIPDATSGASYPLLSDDDGSVVEDDRIDAMLPGRAGKKRQLKLSESLVRGPKRPKSTNHTPRSRKFTTSRQGKITSHVHRAPGASKADKTNRRNRNSKRSGGEKKSRGSTLQHIAPRLSILDVIEPTAPRFLKIAARAAKRRPGQGRSSPTLKAIQLATRQDQIDAASALHEWREGSIHPRQSVTTAMKNAKPCRPPLQASSGNARQRQKSRAGQAPSVTRKFVKHVSDGGSVTYGPETLAGKPSSANPPPAVDAPSHHVVPTRPAQLEVDERDSSRRGAFHARKRVFDRLYRNTHLGLPLQASVADIIAETETAADPDDSVELVQTSTTSPAADHPAGLRRRKLIKPRRVDIEAPEFQRAKEPLPAAYVPEQEAARLDHDKFRLLGLGPYGTIYTQHFEVFPLDPRVYFHETSLIGGGILASYTKGDISTRPVGDKPSVLFNLGSRALRWGPWDAQVSSELGIVFDFVAEQAEPVETSDFETPSAAIDACMFVLRYVKESLCFRQDSDTKAFAARIIECLSSFSSRISSQVDRVIRAPDSKRTTTLRVLDRVLLVALAILRICGDDRLLSAEQFQAEDLLRSLSKTSMSILYGLGSAPIKKLYDELQSIRARERGLRDDAAAIQSWIVLMKVLEAARIPRTSFWEVAQSVIVSPSVAASTDARELECAWEFMFTLLPLVEFSDSGVIVSGRRFDANIDGWTIPQALLKRVFCLYQDNTRQSPSFNDYCRALVGRCHCLVQQWGWRRSATIVGVIFDFFGSQDLAHLRNEEAYESPRFLEELAARPALDVEPGDKCFHIFLKLVGLSIRKLREVGAMKDIRNLVARTIPNHNRQHLKEQNVHARDLAALRNHHDLLATLFWAAPPDLRPMMNLIERLVPPESSHKEACLISIRCWSQLARFIVATGEASTSFKPFNQWRNYFFQQVLRQFSSVAPEIHQQVLALAKDGRQPISEDLINDTIARNKEAVGDVIYASVVASLDVLKAAADLEAASFSLNTHQLQIIFQQFSVAPPDLDWETLQAAITTLDSFLGRIDEFKEKEESQDSESQILNSALADDALETVERVLLRSFFSMARCVMSSRREKRLHTVARGKTKCIQHVVTLSARLGSRYIKCGSFELSDMFKTGTYGLFTTQPHQLDLHLRQHIVHFVSTLVKSGLDDWTNSECSLPELWTLSLVKPREYLEYENELGKQLHRSGKDFVPDAVVALEAKPDYGTNRDLFEFAISQMRRSIRDAGPSLRSILLTEHSTTLQRVMEQIKSDLKTASNSCASSHQSYVVFIRSIVSLIKSHGSEIRPVDSFFYQISNEYSPSIEDPQLQVAGLISYGVRLKEGDSRSSQQLFHLLLSNVKFAISHDKLREDVNMLRKGMANQGIVDFILGKMLPSCIRAAFKNISAYPLLDVYAEALRILMAKRTVSYELAAADLPHAINLAQAAIEGMGSWATAADMLSSAHLHLLRQVVAALNLLWPGVRIFAASDLSSQTWTRLSRSFVHLHEIMTTAAAATGSLVRNGETVIAADDLLGGNTPNGPQQPRLDSDIKMFTDLIVKDVATGWGVKEGRMTTPASNHGAASAKGVPVPMLNAEHVLQDLHERTQEWCWWWDEVFGQQAMAPLFRLPDEALLALLVQRFPGRDRQIRSLATLLHPDAAPCRNLVLHGTEATGKSAITAQVLAELAAIRHDDITNGDGCTSSGDSVRPSSMRYAVVNAAQCITGRHLFERIVGAVADALRLDGQSEEERRRWDQQRRRCESLAQLAVALGTLLKDPTRDPRWRFVLVLDAIDRQRDAPPTLLPALARLSELVGPLLSPSSRCDSPEKLTVRATRQIPCLTSVFTVTAPPAGFLRTPASPHLHFPPYTKPEFVRILALAPPAPVAGTTQRETSDLWTRFCAAVHDAFVRSAARTLPAFRHGCRALWPRFTAPVVAGTYSVKEFSKLLVAARVHFQDESLLNPSIVSVRPAAGAGTTTATTTTASSGDASKTASVANGTPKPTTTKTPGAVSVPPAAAQLTALLPIAARILLLSAYLASHNAARHDLTVFSTYHHGRKRRRGGGYSAAGGGSSTPRRAKHRKIARKLLGAHAFVLERMLAIFEAVRGEWLPEGSSVGTAAAVVDGDVGMAIATLASLRLLVRVGAGDTMDRAGKWRVNVGWDAIRGIGRSIGVEVEEWLIE